MCTCLQLKYYFRVVWSVELTTARECSPGWTQLMTVATLIVKEGMKREAAAPLKYLVIAMVETATTTLTALAPWPADTTTADITTPMHTTTMNAALEKIKILTEFSVAKTVLLCKHVSLLYHQVFTVWRFAHKKCYLWSTCLTEVHC